MRFAALLFAAGCEAEDSDTGPPCGPAVVYLSPGALWDGGEVVGDSCYTEPEPSDNPAAAGTADYRACCPDGFEPVGWTAGGDLVCVEE